MTREYIIQYAYNRLRDDYNDLLKRSEQDAKDAKQWREHVKYCKFQGIDLDYQITTTPTPPAAQRQPLTDEQALKLIQQDYRMDEYADAALKLIRSTEAAHGIKEKNT